MNTVSTSLLEKTVFHSGTLLTHKHPSDQPTSITHGCISGERKYHALLLSIFQLRHRVFNQRLNWDVSSINGYEADKFDTQQTNYIITTDSENNVNGCVRILPTTAPYMLSEIFPFLWQSDSPLPCTSNIYELSRFAFDKGQNVKGYGFSSLVINLLRNLFSYAKNNNIDKYVFVTTAAIERMLKMQGVSIERVGHTVSMHNAKALVLFMNINSKTKHALFT
jgi:acyl homoserine lactone synthase